MSDLKLQPTEVTIRMNPKRKPNQGVQAFVQLELNNLLVINDVTIVAKKNGGVFVGMPSRYDPKNDKRWRTVMFKDAHRDNTAGRAFQDKLEKYIVDQYEKHLEAQPPAEQQPAPTPETGPDDWTV
jgi:DNA-binding cell septation regulator SpoVG